MHRDKQSLLRAGFSFLFLLVILALIWFWFTHFDKALPEYLLPSPKAVWERARDLWNDGLLQKHLTTTVSVLLIGILKGAFAAIGIGAVVSRIRWLRAQFVPLVVATQSIPLVAYAPLLVLFFGSDASSREGITAFVCFFPIFSGTLDGFRQDVRELNRLFASLNARLWQRWVYLRIPLAVPFVFAGVRSALPFALVGVVVSEFLGADTGLGYLIQAASAVYDTPMLFVAVLSLGILGMILFFLLELVGVLLLRRYLRASDGY